MSLYTSFDTNKELKKSLSPPKSKSVSYDVNFLMMERGANDKIRLGNGKSKI